MITDVVVIGGGPAGLMAASTAAKRGKKVILLEKNSVIGKKLRITGKGRCNVTNSADMSEFIENVLTNPNFMYSAFYSFTNQDVIDFFESQGVKLKEERGGRIFPVSDSAHDIADTLVKYAKSLGVVIKKDVATEVCADNGTVTCVNTAQNGKILCSSAIIATGGVSYPLTGSTGDGYKFAENLGHKIVPPKPSLVPLVVKEKSVAQLQGLSLKNISVRIFESDKCVYEDFGEMMFTHYGLTGPVILSSTSNLRKLGHHEYKLHIDLKPALDDETLDKRIQRDFEKYINKNFSNALDDLLPQKMIPYVIKLSGIDPFMKVHQINKIQRLNLCNVIKNLEFTVTGPRPVEEAIITSGGICVKEINPSTMESKIIKNLYFAGEVIDVDAYTGGFNLQIAFSTGYLAGNNAN